MHQCIPRSSYCLILRDSHDDSECAVRDDIGLATKCTRPVGRVKGDGNGVALEVVEVVEVAVDDNL
jgi:hypothetical protein